MEEDLKVIDLYVKTSKKDIQSFNKYIDSSYSINSNFEKFEADFEWLDLMEGTTMYLDNILRNPNRFIVNEEEIVNVEKARRVTVESIKHLSRHTNFIQKIEANGDVKPSKILNINKDENYNTYENRVIYTLINNMGFFIERRKKELNTTSYEKNVKKGEYSGATRIGSEKISISVNISTSSNLSKEYEKVNDMTVEQRIEKLELMMSDLRNSEVYKLLKRENVAKIVPPIKKTNLILKNVNFQYAMRLWDYIQNYEEDGNKKNRGNTTFKEDSLTKDMFNDVFLLNYLVIDSVDNTGAKKNREANKEVIDMLTNNMITKIIELNPEMPLEDLQRTIGDRIAIIKNKKQASIEEIQQKFNVKIQSAISKIVSFNFGGNL